MSMEMEAMIQESEVEDLCELALMCGRMLSKESDQVEKYVGGLPDNIQGNVISARPKTMQEAIVLANDLMDQKTAGHDAAYGMLWRALMKMMIDKYCSRSEIKKLEIKFWNLMVKGMDVVSYTQRFQELALMYGRMLPNESAQVEKYVDGIPDNIQGNVMSARPKTMQEAIKLENDLMDQKVRTYDERHADNKRRLVNNPGDNHDQQPPFKQKNMARVYTAGSGEKKVSDCPELRNRNRRNQFRNDSKGRNNNHRKKTTIDTVTSSALGLDGILKDVTPRVDVAKKVVSPSVVEESATKESPRVNTSDLGSYPLLPSHEANSVSNALGKPSYANATAKPSGTKVNFHTLYTLGGNGIDVVVPVESIRAISERFANTAYGFFLGKRVAYLVVANYARNTWGKYGLKWHPGVNLLKEDVSIVPVCVKLHGVLVTKFSEYGLSAIATKLGTPIMLESYMTDMCMQSWGRSSYARAMIELKVDVELKENIVAAMPKIVGEGYYTCNIHVEYEWKPPSQTLKGILVGQKMGFKPLKQQVYQPVLKKSFANNRGNKKINVEPTNKVDEDSEDEVASVDNDMDNFLAKNDGYCTQSLLEKWKDSHDDYEYDPYDDDLYEG
nr:hypothetical protein [Tanacetum cinerariifolium]